MKRNLLVLLLALALVATMFASCDKGGECAHTFSENWANDATQHWHPATCEHGEIKDSLNNHVDADEDGTCDVCAYDELGHEHTFEELWETDEYYHWHASTCSHGEEKGEYDLHSDAVADNLCDICGSHVHSMNIIGYCAVASCGKQLEENVANIDVAMAVYAAGVTGYGKINGGSIDYEFTSRSNTNASFASTATQKIDYTLGNGHTYSKNYSKTKNGSTEATSTLEGWYEVDGDGVFGVVSEDGGQTFEIAAAGTDHLYGYYYALSTFADGHGAENILYRLFELSQDPNAIDFKYTLDEPAGKASFSYNYLAVNVTSVGTNVNYFEVEVSFTFAQQYALTSLDISLDCYTSDPGVADGIGFLEEDVDLDYNETTGVFALRANAKPDSYVISVTQTVGERNEENENPKSKFVPESYDIFSDVECNNLINSGISAKVKSFLYIYLGNYKPEGTSVDYVNEYMRFEILDADGNLLLTNKDDLLGVQSSDAINAYYSYSPTTQSRFFAAYPKKAGIYTLSIYFLDEKTHEVKIYAGVKNEEEVAVGNNQFAVEISETYSWVDECSFTATKAGTYTFSFDGNLAFVNADEFDAAYDEIGTLVGEEPTRYYDYQDLMCDGSQKFNVTLAAGESIRFYVSSDTTGTKVITYSVK